MLIKPAERDPLRIWWARWASPKISQSGIWQDNGCQGRRNSALIGQRFDREAVPVLHDDRNRHGFVSNCDRYIVEFRLEMKQRQVGIAREASAIAPVRMTVVIGVVAHGNRVAARRRHRKADLQTVLSGQAPFNSRGPSSLFEESLPIRAVELRAHHAGFAFEANDMRGERCTTRRARWGRVAVLLRWGSALDRSSYHHGKERGKNERKDWPSHAGRNRAGSLGGSDTCVCGCLPLMAAQIGADPAVGNHGV